MAGQIFVKINQLLWFTKQKYLHRILQFNCYKSVKI